MITVFTPTYNRAHTLERLHQSLLSQDCYDFEWLIINDGSTDNTDELLEKWKQQSTPFEIRCYNVDNGGKPRAINKALQLARGEYFFIVDSDDFLTHDAISFINSSFETLSSKNAPFIGISGIRGGLDGTPLNGRPKIGKVKGYVDANNLERHELNLQADMAEVFYTKKLRNYKFPVWEGEKFTPEAVVWDRLALDGFKLRWFDKVIYLCDYQPDGLSNSSWRLLRDNPMGYAMLFNVQLEYAKGVKNILRLVLQYLSCCMLAKEYGCIKECHNPLVAFLLVPAGWLLSKRRKKQFARYA